jgi:hypothetical protein
MRAFYAEGQLLSKTGDKFHLVCDFFTIDVVEQVTGETWDEVIAQLGDDKPPRALLIKVLYGLLRKRHEEITLDEAAAVFMDCDRLVFGATIGTLISQASNWEEKSEGEDTGGAKKKPDGQSPSSEKNG